MSADRMDTEFYCADCDQYFESASNLLTHFALHASQNIYQNDKHNHLLSCKTEKKCIPDLYPINMMKNNLNESKLKNDTDFEADFNPVKYCSVSMETKEGSLTNKIDKSLIGSRKRYPCSFCSKIFGWSTDLKRHVLIHTGERPFKCKICDASFTRNFLLQKHENKTHVNKNESKTIPSLKPMHASVLNGIKNSRKQDKQKIKRKCFYDANKSEEFCGLLRSQLNFIDKETIVQ